VDLRNSVASSEALEEPVYWHAKHASTKTTHYIKMSYDKVFCHYVNYKFVLEHIL